MAGQLPCDSPGDEELYAHVSELKSTLTSTLFLASNHPLMMEFKDSSNVMSSNLEWEGTLRTGTWGQTEKIQLPGCPPARVWAGGGGGAAVGVQLARGGPSHSLPSLAVRHGGSGPVHEPDREEPAGRSEVHSDARGGAAGDLGPLLHGRQQPLLPHGRRCGAG